MNDKQSTSILIEIKTLCRRKYPNVLHKQNLFTYKYYIHITYLNSFKSFVIITLNLRFELILKFSRKKPELPNKRYTSRMNSLMDLKENFPDVKIHQVTLNTERLFHIEQNNEKYIICTFIRNWIRVTMKIIKEREKCNKTKTLDRWGNADKLNIWSEANNETQPTEVTQRFEVLIKYCSFLRRSILKPKVTQKVTDKCRFSYFPDEPFHKFIFYYSVISSCGIILGKWLFYSELFQR